MPEHMRSGDKNAETLVQWSRSYWIETCFDRAEKLKPCPSGLTGACCRICHLGPCRFYQSGEERIDRGVCGASLAVVVARNILRMSAAGASAISAVGREMAVTLSNVACGKARDFEIKDIRKLQSIAEAFGIACAGRTTDGIAQDVAGIMLDTFSRHDGAMNYLKRVPPKTMEMWESCDMTPAAGIDREIVEAVYSTTMGVEQEPEGLLTSALRAAIAGGCYGAMIAIDVSDLLLGKARPVNEEAGLGLLREDIVNIVFAGHDPTLPELLMKVISEPEMVEYAKSKGAAGIKLSTLSPMRHGPAIAGGFTNQELCMVTGLVDALVTGLQGIMPGLAGIANNFHTKVVSTSKKGKMPGVSHIEYSSLNAGESVREIVRLAIDNYPNRTGNGERINDRYSAVSGLFFELRDRMDNGAAGILIKDFNAAIIEGRIRGIACLMGSDNPRVQATGIHKYLARELVSDNVLVFTTEGGSASCAMSGYLDPETAKAAAGPLLRQACQDLNIPPVVHLGGSIDNARLLTMLSSMVSEESPFDGIAGIPAVVIAPEWFSERELATAFCFAASGMTVIMGGPSPVEASEEVTKIMSEVWPERFGGSVVFEPDFEKILEHSLKAVNRIRENLRANAEGEVKA